MTAFPRIQNKNEPVNPACLLLLPTGRDADLVSDACADYGISTRKCGSPDELFEQLQDGNGPVLIAAEVFGQTDWNRLEKILAMEPEWSDLPVLILCRTSSMKRIPAEIARRRSVTLLKRPTEHTTLMSLVQADVEARRRQYQVRGLVKELQDVNRELDSRVHQLRQLALVLTRAEEAERRRVAHTLHDDLQQLLAAARVNLGQLMPDDPADTGRTEAVAKISSILGEAIDASRNLSRDLSPPLLHMSGLGPALEQLGDRLRKKHGLQVEVKYDESTPAIDETLRTFLFQAARELLFNVHKHAASNHARLYLTADNGRVAMTVEDDGKGCETEQLLAADAAREGFGLFGIKERSGLLGGTFELDSRPGNGTRATVTLPLETVDNSTDELSAGKAAGTQGKEPGGMLNSPPVRVLVVDDHRVMREGLVSMLNSFPEIEVAGEADRGTAALHVVHSLRPDVVVMDVSLPDMSGIEVTRRIRTQWPDTAVVGLSMFEDPAIADDMLAAGASAYLVKSGPTEGLISSILACRDEE